MLKHKFPAGEYWIGDPCYAIADENWLPILEQTGYFGHDVALVCDYDDGLFTYNGKPCFAASTLYGDGCYRGSNRKSYGVDAGLIGILPLEACDGTSMDGGHITVFPVDFWVWEDGGVFHFGDITISTK